MAPEGLTTIRGHAFLVTDRLGDITQFANQGLFAADTRVLSRYSLRWNSEAPALLRSGSDGAGGTHFYATNALLGSIPAQSLSLVRRQSLGTDLKETIEISNHGSGLAELVVAFEADTDFADIFEVRSFMRANPPDRVNRRVESDRFVFVSRPSNHKRETSVAFSVRPDSITAGQATFFVRLFPGASWSLSVRIEWTLPVTRTSLPVPTSRGGSAQREPGTNWLENVPELRTADLELRRAYDQCLRDLASLEIPLNNGDAILGAGVPWYMAIFGRDAILASLQVLPIAPHFAIGTLRTLAAYQSERVSDFRDAEPGKMPHEIRFGPLSESDELPYSRYYGTADATPLWLILFAETIRWTGDRALAEELMPSALKALEWIDRYGDLDGDGFVEYQTRSRYGLVNQGWKDSLDSVRFADGRLAEAPIALAEVQGYVYAGKLALADVFESMGNLAEAAGLRAGAQALRQRVHDAFWMPEEQCYAMALDKSKRQVNAVASNQGHLLWTGIPEPEFGRLVVERLISPDCFSGWGIRTLASSMTGFNPIGYHTGSVWPHDTALIAVGFRRYGCHKEAAALANRLIQATVLFDNDRLPELFAGWDRDATPFPVECPVACAPQAWASGAIVMLVSVLTGIESRAAALAIDPLACGREFTLKGIPFRGDLYDIEVTADGKGSIRSG